MLQNVIKRYHWPRFGEDNAQKHLRNQHISARLVHTNSTTRRLVILVFYLEQNATYFLSVCLIAIHIIVF